MPLINWKIGRWIGIAVAVASALAFLGIAESTLGIGLSEMVMGFELGTLLGIGNIITAYILYKIL